MPATACPVNRNHRHGLMADLDALTDHSWPDKLPRASDAPCLGLGLGFYRYMLGDIVKHAMLCPAPKRLECERGTGFYTLDGWLTKNVASYSAINVVDGTHYSRWGYGVLCLECGEFEGATATSSVTGMDRPRQFADQHRHTSPVAA